MLVSKINKNDVVTIKLVSGEEVIGYYESEDDNNVMLRKPVVPVPTGNQSMGLAPYIMSSDYLTAGNGVVPFNRSSITTTLSTSKQFRDVYVQQVSGIDLSGGKTSGLIT